MQKIVMGILIAGIIALLANTCSIQQELRNAERSQLLLAEDYRIKVDMTHKQIATQQQVIARKNSELSKLADTLKAVRNQKAQVRVEVKTEYLPSTVDTVEVDRFDGISFLRLPYRFREKSKWFEYSFNIDSTGYVNREVFSYRSDIVMVLGEENHGRIKNLYKANRPIVYIEDRNPNAQITNIQNMTIGESKTRFSWSVFVGPAYHMGSSNGFGLAIGTGISYDLKRF